MNRDYEMLQRSSSAITHYNGTGTAMSMAANRISFIFNLTGPSFAIDSACSSSLVALHLACQALKQGIWFSFLHTNTRQKYKLIKASYLNDQSSISLSVSTRGLWDGSVWRGQLHIRAENVCCSEQGKDDFTRWDQQTFFQKSGWLW